MTGSGTFQTSGCFARAPSTPFWVGWDGNYSPLGWYINLQEPFSRSTHGFQYMDRALDIVVDADRRWRWKDEDELQLMVDFGVFSPALAHSVREEGARLILDLESDRPPFCDDWHSWRPDPAWTIPVLPDGWADVT